jgi:ribosomal protein S1
MEVKGIVKNLTDYGAFVDLGATLVACCIRHGVETR